MKKIFICGAVLSLMLWACGDESSSGSESSELSSSSGVTNSESGNVDYKFECSNNKNQENSELVVNSLNLNISEPRAWKYTKGNSVSIVVGDIMMQCAIPVKSMDVALSGDTLYADYEVDLSAPQANCICPTKVSFTVDAEYEGAKYVNISGETYLLQDTTDDGASAFNQKEAEVARGECMKDDLSLAKAADLPVAKLDCGEENCVVEVNDVMDYCEVRASVSQRRSDDTLYVEYANMGAVSKCICKFDYHRFVIDQENADAKYFSFKEKVFQVVALPIDK